ncbi:mannose-1-phosphate guanylyltransferase/mannose-6-phosphate isomerase, partial [Escherichia coli]|nr:mannose-1-phosphate guanylyltransferase/mannose-6-phosphate isomerase [Escherichia coli]
LSADHIINNNDEFCDAVNNSIILSDKGNLVTYGIVPTKPETGYGYILRGDLLSSTDQRTAFKVERFVEKPNMETAQA